MTTIRVERRHRYTSIDRGALNDRRLSYRARGILAYLLDKPDDWKTTADAIAVAGREGREAVRTALNELEAVGYLVRRKWRNEGGQWASEWTVLERPKGTEPGRETGAGQPPREAGPQLLKTDTQYGPTEPVSPAAVDPNADPDCVQCHGEGHYYFGGSGTDRTCPCTEREHDEAQPTPRPKDPATPTVEAAPPDRDEARHHQ